ncbi:dsRNA-specific ribonuclease [Methanococcoides sp. SA1]|nr:dsRNA-specific ribonuclease [Methanococcoides sp. SA1]
MIIFFNSRLQGIQRGSYNISNKKKIGNDVEDILGYYFNDRKILEQALTTKSYSNENSGSDQSEFQTLGDAVIKLLLTEMLFESGNKSGGTITSLRIKNEKKEGLARTARCLDIKPFIRLGKGQEIENHGDNDHVLAETLEAIAGAIFVDGGYEKSKSAILNWFVAN